MSLSISALFSIFVLYFRHMGDYKSNISSIDRVLWDIVHSVESSNDISLIAKEPVASYGSVMNDRFRLSSILQAGFRYTLFERLMSLMPFNLSDWSDILDMAPKTMARYKADDKSFRPIHAEKIIDMAKVTEAGLTFFEDMADFKVWLRTPSMAFNKKAPMDLITDGYGRSLVLDQLVRMEHGIFI